jgi:Ca2+-binding RTX toxin-like protein
MRRTLIAVSFLLAVPATADAASVTVTGTPPAVQFQAAPGEANQLDVHDGATGLLVADAGATLTTDGTCTAGAPVMCPFAPVIAHLGDRDDRASAVSQLVPATVYGEDGSDDILASGFRSFAYGGPGDDSVRVNAGTDAFAYGGTGSDTIHAASAGGASAFGEAGSDVLIGEDAVTTLLDGGAGNDVLVGLPSSFGPVAAHGGPGNDVLAVRPEGGSGRVASWTLTGDAGRDAIAGGPGADTISGGGGNDAIHAAGGGADTISCGSGFDVVRADSTDTVAADCEWRWAAASRKAPKIARALRLAARG